MKTFRTWKVEDWSFIETATALILPGLLYVLFLTLDTFGVEKVKVRGTVIELRSVSGPKQSANCIVTYKTSIGEVNVPSLYECEKLKSVGGQVNMLVTVGRITGRRFPYIPSIRPE